MLYDVGSQNGVDYLVMECVEGETLAKRLEKGALPLEQVLRYGMQIADALDKAHRSGVVHRDLKPSNIMLTATGVKLLDFGLAKPAAPLASLATLTVAASHSSPVTEPGTIVGTFQYMSPEQVEGKEVDGRSDIFSLGAVLFEMVTGQRAFPGKSQLSVASAVLDNDRAAQRTEADDPAGAGSRDSEMSCERSGRTLADGARFDAGVEVDRGGEATSNDAAPWLGASSQLGSAGR